MSHKLHVVLSAVWQFGAVPSDWKRIMVALI